MGLKDIIKKAEENDVESMIVLARAYLLGKGVDKDEEKAIDLLSKAAKENNKIAITYLAYLYLKGIGVDKNSQKSLELYKKAADLDDDVALYSLGLIYKKGLLGEDQDEDLAKSFFEKSAALNNSFAKYEIALSLEKEAIEKLKNADTVTQSKIAITRNKNEAAFKEAADKGLISAKYALAVIYASSIDKQKQEKALALLRECEGFDIPIVYYALAHMYDQGIGIEIDYWKSYEYFKKAYDAGYKKAILNLIYAHMVGLGCKKDYATVINLSRDAVNSGVKEGNYYAGLCFLNGYSVDENIEKAEELFGYAAQASFAPAYYELGKLYDPYFEIGEDLESAKENYKKAYELGCFDAGAELARLDIEKSKQALDLLRESLQKGSIRACEIFGELFEKGMVVQKDNNKAAEYYKKAADMGSSLGAKYIVEHAKKVNNPEMLKRYQDKATSFKGPKAYVELAKSCLDKNEYERSAFWYAMALEYTKDDDNKTNINNIITSTFDKINGVWTKK